MIKYRQINAAVRHCRFLVVQAVLSMLDPFSQLPNAPRLVIIEDIFGLPDLVFV